MFSVIQFEMQESEDIAFAEVDCASMDSNQVCSRENIESFPTLHMYQYGDLEDIFAEER